MAYKRDANTGMDLLRTLTREQHLQLVADILDFFTTNPECPEAWRVSEMLCDPRFKGYSRQFLKHMVASLVCAGVIFKLPHRSGRDQAYVAFAEGRLLRDLLLARLEGRR